MIKQLIAILLCLLIAPPAWAAVTVDANSTGASATGTTVTIAHTVSGTNTYILVGCGFNTGGATTISSVTWNTSENLTQIGTRPRTGTIATDLWGLVAPTATTANIVVTKSASGVDSVCKVVSFNGVDQSTPIGTSNQGTGTAAAPSIAVTSSAGELVVDVLGWRTNATPTATPDGSQTAIGTQQSCVTSTNCRVHMSYETAAGASTTMSWTETLDQSAQVGVPLKPAAATVVPTSPIFFP